MDKPMLIVEVPVLDDQSATYVYQFLQDLTLAFESCYYKQLVRYRRNCECDYDQDMQDGQPFFDDEIPF